MQNNLFNDVGEPLFEFLEREDIYDLCVNKLHQVCLLTSQGWEQHKVESINERWCKSFVNFVAGESKKTLDKKNPILSTELPTGERIQVLIPPAVNEISITIRRPNSTKVYLENYVEKGLLNKSRAQNIVENKKVKQAKDLYDNNESVEACLKYCIENKLTTMISGSTGSGKTTIVNTLSAFIPSNERIGVIEDAAEMSLDQDNIVRMFYARNTKDPVVTADELLGSCMRMSFDRIIFGELRGPEAFFFLDQINTGHAGSITTIHASSAKGAMKRLVKLIKRSEEGRGFTNEEITEDIVEEVDVIFQWNSHGIDHAYFPKLESGK
jgi:type IV secretion system protein VirB11